LLCKESFTNKKIVFPWYQLKSVLYYFLTGDDLMKKLFFLLIIILIFSLLSCPTSLKGVNISNISVYLEYLEYSRKKIPVESLIPGNLYRIKITVHTAEGKDITNPALEEFSFASPNNTLSVVEDMYVRVNPNSFIFIDGKRCELKIKAPGNDVVEELSLPIDWDNYDIIDFSGKEEFYLSRQISEPGKAAVADYGMDYSFPLLVKASKDIEGSDGSDGENGLDGKNVQLQVAYYLFKNQEKTEVFMVLYEQIYKILYAFKADKKITIITNGSDGKRGDDGNYGDGTGNGGNGGDGGNGGSAGSITIIYHGNSDIINYLRLLAIGGKGGLRGGGGTALGSGMPGNSGRNGAKGRDGQIILFDKDSFNTMFNVEGFPDFDKNNLRVNK
jgi:hypothetical protein